MDCEMCETTDPVTGEKCENALVRFSVIDCTNNGQVILTYLYLCSKYLLEVTLAALDVGPDRCPSQPRPSHHRRPHPHPRNHRTAAEFDHLDAATCPGGPAESMQ